MEPRSDPFRYEFRIQEWPRRTSSKVEEEKLRFTEGWPPFVLWESTPNWCWAPDEETCCDQDETTVKPAKNQTTIDRDMAYTAGEAWLPDNRIIPCMIGLDDDGDPCTVVCFDSETIWELPCAASGNGIPNISKEQKKRFPLRIVSRLSRSKKNPSQTIRLEINEDGQVIPWIFQP